MFQGINAIKFSKKFIDNDSCFQYLMERNGERVINAHDVVMENLTRERPGITKDVNNADTMKA